MHRSFFIILLVFIININSAFSKNDPSFQKRAPWVQGVEYSTQIGELLDVDDGGVYLIADYQYNTILKEQYVHFAIKIENESGIQNYSDIWVNYFPNYQKLIFHKLVVIRDNHEYNRLVIKDIKTIQNESNKKSKSYSERYSSGLFIEDVQVGDIIEYSYTIRGKNTVLKNNYFDDYSLQFSQPLNKLFIKVITDKEHPVFYKLFKSDEQPQEIEQGDKLILQWELTDIEEVVSNSNLPSWYMAYATLQLSSFSEWSEMIDWGLDLYPQKNLKGTILEKKIDEITNGLETNSEKINAIVNFVQDEVRYVAIAVNENNYRPHDPVAVFKKRYGDCKDKTYLLTVMLNHIGVKASPALVHTSWKHTITDFLPSPLIFDHIITAINYGDKLYFIDATASNQYDDFTKSFTSNYGKALIISDDYTGPVDTKINSVEKIVINEIFNVVDTVSPVSFTVESTYYGSEASQIRSSFQANSIKSQQNAYMNFYSQLYPEMHIADELKVIDAKKEDLVKVVESYDINNFWTYDSSASVKDYVSNIKAFNLLYYVTTPDQKNRTMPYNIYFPIEIENRIEFNHANEINIDVEKGEISNSVFKFTYSIEKEGNSIIFNYKYKTLKDFMSTSEMEQYYKDVGKIYDLTVWQFTYGVGTADNDTATATNWLLVTISVFFIIILLYIARQLYISDLWLSVAGNKKALDFGGWLILPIIGVVLSPIVLVFMSINAEFFSLTSWEFVSSADSLGYDSLWAIVFIMELLINIFMLVYSVLLIFLLFNKRTVFPTHYIIFRVSYVLFIAFDYYLMTQIDNEYFVLEQSDLNSLIKAVVSTAIWVPYMLSSDRVRDTFVNIYKR